MDEKPLNAIAAYHTKTLRRIQHVYDVLVVDVQQYLSQERNIADEIRELSHGLQQLSRDGLLAAPVHLPSPTPSEQMPTAPPTVSRKYQRIDRLSSENFDELVKIAERSLREQGVNPERDPLLQVLDGQQVREITASYREKYGDVLWDDADYAVVALAGAVGAVLELLLVKLPGHSEFLLTLPQGCAMTAWLAASFKRIQAECPETHDALLRNATDPSSGNWLWRFITVLLDLVRYSGTTVDDHGNIVTAQRLVPEQERIYASCFLQMVFRTLSALFETVAINPPFASIQASLADSADSWDGIAAYAQTHGYRPVRFLREGVIPAAIELFVQGYWLLRHYRTQEQLSTGRLKLTSMLALSHTLAVSGYFVKSGLLFHIDPLTLNWSHILRCVPLLLSWLHEGLEREHTIRSALDDEWRRLYQRSA